MLLRGDRRHAGDEKGTFIHGGVLAAFLEATALLYVCSIDPRARLIEFTSTFLRRSALTDTLAHARELNRGRRFVMISVSAWQTDASRPVAIGYGTIRVH
jgi:acyl-coenzyme A thioesterase PaaI-like protein